MWNCKLCRVSFGSESMEFHLYTNHVRVRSGPLKLFDCGQCMFTAESFDDIAVHCSKLRHDPSNVRLGASHQTYPADMLAVLEEMLDLGGGGSHRRKGRLKIGHNDEVLSASFVEDDRPQRQRSLQSHQQQQERQFSTPELGGGSIWSDDKPPSEEDGRVWTQQPKGERDSVLDTTTRDDSNCWLNDDSLVKMTHPSQNRQSDRTFSFGDKLPPPANEDSFVVGLTSTSSESEYNDSVRQLLQEDQTLTVNENLLRESQQPRWTTTESMDVDDDEGKNIRKNKKAVFGLHRRRNQSFPISQKLAIVDEAVRARSVENGESMNSIARRHGIVPKMIRAWISQRDQLAATMSKGVNQKRVKRTQKSHFTDVESKLMEWYRPILAKNISLSPAVIQQKARNIGQALGILKFTASTGWYEKFKQRHNLNNNNNRLPSSKSPAEAETKIEEPALIGQS